MIEESNSSTSHRVVIVGGGFSGIGAAIRLLERGIRDFVILEKGERLGGTWRDNTYPGCACDVPSHLYSYSYAPKNDWTRAFAPAAEIQQYTLDVAEKFGVMPHVRLGTELLRATWDDARARWQIETNRGRLDAQFVIAGQGPLHEPAIPALPGLSSFRGVAFHSARWRHDADLRGKRVAVIGTGSSAIQLVPQIQPKVSQLYLFQRTAPHVLPKLDHEIRPAETWILDHVPLAQRALRGAIYGATELLQIAERHPRAMKRLERLAHAHLRRQIRDPELRRALTPSFTLGCKRMLFSNTYYPALAAPNTEVVPHAVATITERGVIGADGIEREVDAIIFGTGFHVTDTPLPTRIVGKRGQSLHATWAGSPNAYLGTAVSGFPNAFLMVGPNSGNGHGSVFTIIEAQANYICDAIETAGRDGIAAIDVRAGVQRAWNEDVQAALATTVWNAGGCASWYIDKNGKNSAIYPWTTIDMRRRMRRFDRERYELRPAAQPAIPVPKPARRKPAPIELRGAVVAITGGAHGIGLATARAFADRGAIVCIGDLDVAAAREATVGLGPRARAWQLDVSKRASFEAFVGAIEREVGPIDVLVNNAGIMPTGRFLDEPDETHAAAMSVNTWGVSLGMRLVLPAMIARGRGHVVNVASLAGKAEVPWMATYVASKHAVVGLTGAVRNEIDGSGVTLSVLMPGVIDTRLAAGISHERAYAQPPEVVARAIVDSVRTRRADIVAPKLLAGVPVMYALAPRAVHRWIYRTFRADRIVGDDARVARAGYEHAARAQAPDLDASAPRMQVVR